MSRFVTRLVLAVAVLAMLGCQSLGPGHDLLVDPFDSQKIGYSHRWSRSMGMQAGRDVLHQAVLGDLVVVVEAPTNLVSAVSLADGSILWMRSVAEASDRLFKPTRRGDRILINSETHLYSLAVENGDVLDVQTLKSPVSSAPALVANLAIFGGPNGWVFAHDIATGKRQWVRDLRGPIRARPVLVQNRVFVANTAGQYKLFTAQGGNLVTGGQTFARIIATPAASRAAIFVASEDHFLYALNPLTLRHLWKFRAPRPLTRSPIVQGDRVFLPVPRYGLIVVDVLTGTEVWKLADRRALPIFSDAEKVLLDCGTELVMAAVDSGRIISRAPTKPLRAVLLAANGSLILVSPRGHLMCLDRL